MSDRGIVLAQARMAIIVALRTPRAIIFTVAFPLILLVLFNSIFNNGGHETTTLPDGLKISAQAYFTAGIIAYAVALSTFTTLTVSLTTQRENGQLKRYRGTPMPPWTFIAAQITRATAQALLMTVVLLAVGAVVYGVPIPTRPSPPSSSTSCSGPRPVLARHRPHRLHPHRRRGLDDRPLHRRHPRLLLRHLDPGRPAAALAGNDRQDLPPLPPRPRACRPPSPPTPAAAASTRQRPRPGDLGPRRRPHRQQALPLGAPGRPGLGVKRVCQLCNAPSQATICCIASPAGG